MLLLSFEQLHALLTQWLWPFIRFSSFIVVCPLLGHSSIPNQAKIGMALLLTMVISPLLAAPPAIPLLSWAALGIMVEQVLIGLALGMVMHIMFAIVQAAGEFIGLQMGLAFASFFSPDTGSNTMILSRLFHMLAILLFLAFNGHLMTIEVLISSFTLLPIAFASLDQDIFMLIVRFAGGIFSTGLLLALPLVSSLLVINLALGILNRAAPQFTVFSVGFPMTLTAGLVLLTVLIGDLGRFLQGLFSQHLQFMQQLLLSP